MIDEDAISMARAFELAQRGLNTTDPNPRVGCVLVHGGQIVGEGWHARAGEPHAEVLALRAAGAAARGAVAYVTLEPCCHSGRTPPCTEALIGAGVARVVCASVDPNPQVGGGGVARLEAAGVPTTTGVLAEQARALNPGFFSRFERGRPWIRLKLAMSLDARTAPSVRAAGAGTWITEAAARADVQYWRARSSAVVTGAGTVRGDDPRLDVRLAYGSWVRQPLRVVLDTKLGSGPDAKVYSDGNALIFTAEDTPDDAPGASALRARGLRVERVPRAADGLELDAVVRRLAALEMNEIFLECGARLAASFLAQELVDELILYVAPRFLGMDAAPLVAMAGANAESLSRFEFREHRLIEQDLRLILTPKRG